MAYPLTILDGRLHVFPYPTEAVSTQRYCFTLSLAHLLGVSSSAIGVTLSRHLPRWQVHVLRPGQGHGKRKSTEINSTAVGDDGQTAVVAFRRLKQTYVVVKAALYGTVEANAAAKSDQLNLYPLPLISVLLQHYEGKVQYVHRHITPTLNSVLEQQKQQQQSGGGDEIKVKLEPMDLKSADEEQQHHGLNDEDEVIGYRDGIPVTSRLLPFSFSFSFSFFLFLSVSSVNVYCAAVTIGRSCFGPGNR